MVRMRVGHDDGVHPPRRNVGCSQPSHQALPRSGTRHAGVDQREPALVFQRVAVDVAQPDEVDRQLEAQDPRCDLGYLVRSLLLLLPPSHGLTLT
jgi:hypothetical protein